MRQQKCSSGLTKDMKAFLKYLKDGTTGGNVFTEKLEREVEKARKSEEWRVEYMTLAVALDDARYEGRIEGIRNTAEAYYELNVDAFTTAEKVKAKYADINKAVIDRIIEEVYQIES